MSRPRISLMSLALAASGGVCVMVFVLLTQSGGNAVDAMCYWLTNPANPYNRVEYQFVYPPIAAQIIAPVLTLPFAVFAALLRIIEVASLFVLAGPLAGVLIFAPPVASEINAANINLAIGVVMVLGFRWPALWAIPLLTKPSMGVGLLWFVLRGEWRKAAIPIGIAGGLSAVSFVYAPHLWSDWLRLLATGTAQVGEWPYPYPIWVRLPIALVLVAWGARTNRPWTVVVASALALPRLYFQSPAILVAVIPLIPSIGRRIAPWPRRLARLDELHPGREGSASDQAKPMRSTPSPAAP